MNISVPTGWNLCNLEEVCSIRNKTNVDSELYIGLEHIGQGNNMLISRGNSKEFKSTKNTFKKGDVLYGKLRPLLNKVYLATEDGYCSTDILPLQANGKISAEFLLRVLTHKNFLSFAVATSSGTKMPRTNWSDIRDFKILLPPSQEQHKIALIVSSLDELIQKTDQIIEQTQRLKKGVMQKLFREALLNNPTVTINEIKDTTPNAISMGPFGSSIKTDNFVSDGVPVIRGVNLTKEPFNMDGFVFLREEKADELRSANSFSNDIVFTHRGTLGQVGIIPEKTKYKRFVISQSQMKLTCNNNRAIPKYVYYFFKSHQGQKALLANISRTGVPSIGQPTTTLKRIKIPLPSIASQMSISSTLTSIENLNQLRIAYREFIVNLKKGLMQNLLTSKIRVKI